MHHQILGLPDCKNLATKKGVASSAHQTAPLNPLDGDCRIQNLQKKRAKKPFYEMHTGNYYSSSALSPSLTKPRRSWKYCTFRGVFYCIEILLNCITDFLDNE